MEYSVFAVRDTCAEVWLMPWFFRSTGECVRSLTDAVNRSKEDNQFYQHPEHYQLYFLGLYDDDNGLFETEPPKFVVDCQSLVNKSGS